MASNVVLYEQYQSCYLSIRPFMPPAREKSFVCLLYTISVPYELIMVPQRFHGVFNSLLKEQGNVNVARKEAESHPSSSPSSAQTGQTPLTGGQVAVDVYEDSGYIVVKAPIAGVKLADLDIDVADNVVTIRGQRHQSDDLSEANMLIEECYWGPFERKVTLPYSVNPAKVKATFSKDNILKVLFPKDEKKIKIIKINEGG